MAWTESGLYAGSLYLNLHSPTVAASPPWTLNTNKFFLTNNTDTPDFTQVAASAIYSATNEVSGTGWAAGGIAASALATGSTDIVLALNASGSKVLSWTAGNVSVATTTLASAYGGYFYASPAVTAGLVKIIGIWFGGSPYSTSAGTFAITWSSGTIATITCAT